MYHRLSCLAIVVVFACSSSHCFAGNLVVVVQDHQLIVTAESPETDDFVRISKPDRDYIRVEAIGGTIYGRPYADFLAGNIRDLTILLGDGNDTVEIDNNPSFRQVVIDLAASGPSNSDKDTIDVTSFNYSGSVAIETGPDQDTIHVQGVENWNFSAYNYFVVDTGNGSDSVWLDQSMHLADFTIIDTRDGRSPDASRNNIEVSNLNTEFLWLIQGGGIDETIVRNVFSDEMYLMSSGGVDYAEILNSEIDELSVKMGSGNDELLISNCDLVDAIVDGESGSDALNFSNVQSRIRFYKRNWEFINGRFQAGTQIYRPGTLSLLR